MEQSLRIHIVKEVECTAEALELDPQGRRSHGRYLSCGGAMSGV